MRLQLPVSSYTLRSLPASCARLVNCIAEPLPPGAKTPLIVTRIPGPRPFTTVGTGPIRGQHKAFGSLFVVSGTNLYKVTQAGVVTDLGSVGSGHISMDHNTENLVVVSQPNAYYTDGTASVTQITDPDFTSRGARYVRFLDNFMLFTEPDTGRYFWADVGETTDFDSLNFTTAEGNPDDIIGIESDHRQAILFGSESTELHQATDSGFQRAINGYIEIGCFNGDTVAKIDNSVVWMANDYTVRKLDGTTPVRISTYAIEQFLTTVDVTTGRAYSYSQDGHIYYVLSFETGCKAWDATTQEWADRASHPEDYYRWQYHSEAYGNQYVGDAYSNKLGILDPSYYAEYGDVQRVAWVYQAIYAEAKLAIHKSLEIVIESGVGLTLGQGSDPEMMIDFSDDDGRTWISAPNRTMGKIGEYRWRVRLSGLGSAERRVYRAAVSDPVKVTVIDTQIDVVGGRL